MYKKPIFLLSVLAFCSCNSSKNDTQKSEVKQIEITNTKFIYTANEFDSIIKNSNNSVLIDVRTGDEFSKGHLENALNLDWKRSEFQKQLESIDKNQTILVYCLSGGRSSQAATAMREKGYTKVLELDGGIMAWRAKGLPEVGIKSDVNGLSLEAYNKLIDSEKLVLVDFNAAWCAPCKKMKPFIDKIEKDFKDRVIVLKIDVDENSSLAKTLKVSGLPALKLYKKGEIIWEHTGFIDEQGIISKLN